MQTATVCRHGPAAIICQHSPAHSKTDQILELEAGHACTPSISLSPSTMRIAYKALWTIESRLHEPLSLEVIAAEVGVSEFHLARAFAVTVGTPVMQYVRRRRLTEAARKLAASQTRRVLDVALDAGYASQEAFTRAFNVEFGIPPHSFRRQAGKNPVTYLEAASMQSTKTIELNAPRIETLPAVRLVGLSRRYTAATSGNIPEQWSRFNELGLAGDAAYGVCYNADAEGNIDYLCGVEVTSYEHVDPSLDRHTLPSQTYAVFAHGGHVSEIRDVWKAIWNQGLNQPDYVVSEGPEFEKYGSGFDPATGHGGFEIWIPVRAA